MHRVHAAGIGTLAGGPSLPTFVRRESGCGPLPPRTFLGFMTGAQTQPLAGDNLVRRRIQRDSKEMYKWPSHTGVFTHLFMISPVPTSKEDLGRLKILKHM